MTRYGIVFLKCENLGKCNKNDGWTPVESDNYYFITNDLDVSAQRAKKLFALLLKIFKRGINTIVGGEYIQNYLAIKNDTSNWEDLGGSIKNDQEKLLTFDTYDNLKAGLPATEPNTLKGGKKKTQKNKKK